MAKQPLICLAIGYKAIVSNALLNSRPKKYYSINRQAYFAVKDY